MMRKVLFALVLATVCSARAANTWYVDDDNYGQSGLDGTTEAKAYGTIQAAIDAATTKSGDTIMVLPGEYRRDAHDDGYTKSRVFVSGKRLNIVARDGKEKTFIIGQRSTDSSGYGADAVRCIYIDGSNSTTGTVFRGFTVCSGGVAKNDGSADVRYCQGGGVYGTKMGLSFLIDCTVSNCLGRAGGAFLGAGAIRCLIVGNRAFVNGAIGRSAIFYNCIGVNNYLNGQPALQGSFAVNCTFVGNGETGAVASENSRLRNCLSLGNAQNLASTSTKFNDLRYSVFCGNAYYGVAETLSERATGVVTNASPMQILAPALGDYRPFAGSVAATNGRGEMIDEWSEIATLAVPADEAYRDFFGTTIPSEGTIAVGAVQTLAPAPKGGSIYFGKGKVKTFGVKNLGDVSFAFGDDYPKQLHFRKDQFVDAGNDIFAYWVDVNNGSNWRPPEMDDSIYLLPPPAVNASLTCGVISVSQVYHVKKSGGSDSNDGLTSDTAFSTIRQATTSLPGGNKYSVIYVGAGDYDAAHEGEQPAMNFTNRVVIPSGNYVRLKGHGRADTFISGTEDTSAAGKVQDSAGNTLGCGPAAVRCIATVQSSESKVCNGAVIVQGFTLRNGRSAQYYLDPGTNKTNNNAIARAGAAAYFADSFSIVADSCVTNCRTGRAVSLYGNFYRTVFDTCYGWNGGVRNGRSFVMCDFVNCEGSGAGPLFYADGTLPNYSIKVIAHCSIRGKNQDYNLWSGACIPTWNCLISTGNNNNTCAEESHAAYNPTRHYGNTLWNLKTTHKFDYYTFADPQFVSDRDLRVFADSPAFYAGAMPTAETFGNDYCRFMASGDIDGKPLALTADGKPIAGCHMRAVTKVAISAPAVGTITPAAGSHAVEDGESLTVTYAADGAHATRPYFGLSTNGVVATEGKTITLTAPSASESPVVFSVEPLTGTNWYVNADAENDEGNGWTPETAKKTLTAIMACDLIAGDVIHAAAGDYNEGESAAEDSYPTSNRVDVVSGVSLISDEGPAKTFIRGRKGTGANSAGYGGVGPVRCVVMRANAFLKGFTLVDGCTAYPVEDPTKPYKSQDMKNEGGGVYCVNNSAVVENCIITNCSAVQGGGAANGVLRNCCIVQNADYGASFGSAGKLSALVGCYIGPQRNDNGTFRGPNRVYNCTFNGSSIGYGGDYNIAYKNSVFINMPAAFGNKSAGSFVNCVFDETTWGKLTETAQSVVDEDTCKHTQIENIGIDPATGRPTGDSGNSYLLDVAGPTNAYTYALNGVDADGNQRVYNGAMDIGAFEYDWRGKYAEKLGVPVKTASANVHLETDSVKIPAGEKLALDTSAIGGRYMRGSALVKGGTLTASVGGEVQVTLTGNTESQNLKVARGDDLTLSMSASGENDAYSCVYPFASNGVSLYIR